VSLEARNEMKQKRVVKIRDDQICVREGSTKSVDDREPRFVVETIDACISLGLLNGGGIEIPTDRICVPLGSSEGKDP
jgi:hypothetical protein